MLVVKGDKQIQFLVLRLKLEFEKHMDKLSFLNNDEKANKNTLTYYLSKVGIPLMKSVRKPNP